MRPIEKQINDRLKEIADLAYKINTLYDDYVTTANVFISYAVDEHGFTIEFKNLGGVGTRYIEFDDLERANNNFIKLKKHLEELFDLKKMLMEMELNWHKMLENMQIRRKKNEKEI